jgi:hypothetical protein
MADKKAALTMCWRLFPRSERIPEVLKGSGEALWRLDDRFGDALALHAWPDRYSHRAVAE